MKAHVRYIRSNQHPRKPVRVEVSYTYDDGRQSTHDCHGRFRNEREATEWVQPIVSRVDAQFTSEYGRMIVEDMPPKIVTLHD
jgi:hypothetical protein